MSRHKQAVIDTIMSEIMSDGTFQEHEISSVEEALKSFTLDEILATYLPQWYGDIYKVKPVDAEEWLFSKEHMNLRGQIFPMLADDFVELVQGGYQEAVIEGAIGYGKSYLSSLTITRSLYELSCLKNPQLVHGLASNSQIVLVNIASKLEIAKEVVFGYVQGFVKASPYFQRSFPADKDLTKEMRFPNAIRVIPAASTQGSVIGQNVYTAVKDEINFLFKGDKSQRSQALNEEFDLAKVLHNAITRRITSRFGMKHKGINMSVSSSMYPTDFTSWRKAEADRLGERIFYRRYSQWTPKPEFQGFAEGEREKDWFYLSVGDSARRPRILLPDSHSDFEIKLDDVAYLEEDKITVLKVPEIFRISFRSDIDMAVRDIAGYATLSRYPFYRNTEGIQRSFDRALSRGLKHPFSLETTSLVDGAHWLKEHLDMGKRLHHHFAHVDLAVTQDAAALSIVRLEGIEKRTVEIPTYSEHLDEIITESHDVYEPILTGVLTLRFKAPVGGEIPIVEIRQLLMSMISWGFLFTKVSYDQFQSVESLQALRQLGVDAGTLSVDRNLDGHNALKQAFEEDRLDHYPYDWILKEASELERDAAKAKVDHPPAGSKDIVDALAGAVFNATVWARENPGIVMQGDVVDDVSPVLFSDFSEDDDFEYEEGMLFQF